MLYPALSTCIWGAILLDANQQTMKNLVKAKSTTVKILMSIMMVFEKQIHLAYSQMQNKCCSNALNTE